MDKDRLLKETIVLLSADLYQTFYDSDECGGWDEAVTKIISLAEQFEKELDWHDGDERDYIFELEKFEKKVLSEIKEKND